MACSVDSTLVALLQSWPAASGSMLPCTRVLSCAALALKLVIPQVLGVICCLQKYVFSNQQIFNIS